MYYPVVPGLEDQNINVHSKLLIVDDRLLKIGSANLSNRSLGLDTECDLVIEAPAEGGATLRQQIAGITHRLLGEHLGLSARQVALAVAQHGSLAGAIDAQRGSPRCLAPMPREQDRR